MLQRLPLMLAALWWGGITALSFLAVPLLFASGAGAGAQRASAVVLVAGLALLPVLGSRSR